MGKLRAIDLDVCCSTKQDDVCMCVYIKVATQYESNKDSLLHSFSASLQLCFYIIM